MPFIVGIYKCESVLDKQTKRLYCESLQCKSEEYQMRVLKLDFKEEAWVWSEVQELIPVPQKEAIVDEEEYENEVAPDEEEDEAAPDEDKLDEP